MSRTIFFYDYLLFQEVNITKANHEKIRDLQNEKGITILYGGVGGYQRPTVSIYSTCQPTVNVLKFLNIFSFYFQRIVCYQGWNL